MPLHLVRLGFNPTTTLLLAGIVKVTTHPRLFVYVGYVFTLALFSCAFEYYGDAVDVGW